jgi:hypothetical protein
MKQQEENSSISSFADTFMSKLKEQSFVIILMLGVIYYQHRMMEERVAFWQKQYEEKETYIENITKEDRDNMLDRIKYLQDQRDVYTQDLIDKNK